MGELEDKLGAILGNPQMMEGIFNLAKQIREPEVPPDSTAPGTPRPAAPETELLQTVASLAGQTGLDSRQQTLLQALGPYLSPERIRKLEKAMQAARLAQAASTVLPRLGNLGR